MSWFVWVKMGAEILLTLAGAGMILVSLLRRKKGWIRLFAVGLVLTVIGAALLIVPLFEKRRESTLVNQRNYIAVKLIEMGDYANASSIAAQADQMKSNIYSKELIVLAAGFRMDVDMAMKYTEAYLEEDSDSVLENAKIAFQDFLDEYETRSEQTDYYSSVETGDMQDKLRKILMELLYEVEESIPAYDDNASVQKMLQLVQQGSYSDGSAEGLEDSLLTDKVEAIYAIQTADYDSLLENAKAQLDKSGSFENRANIANIVASQAKLNTQNEEIAALNQQISELQTQIYQLDEEYNNLISETEKVKNREQAESLAQQMDSLTKEAEVEAANQAINYIEITTPIAERDTVVYKIELARLYYQAREDKEAEELLAEALEESEETTAEPAGILLSDVIDKYKISVGDKTLPDYGMTAEGPDQAWERLTNLFGFFEADSSYSSSLNARDFYTFLLGVMDERYHGMRIRNIDASDFPTVRVTVNISAELEEDVTKDAFFIEELGKEIKNFRLLNTADLGEEYQNISLVLVVDRSGSMDGYPMENTKQAVANFVRSSGDMRLGLVSFDDVAEIEAPLSDNKTNTQKKVNELYARGGTSIAIGLQEAGNMLANEIGKRIIILLSDGVDGSSGMMESVLAELNQKDIIVYTIGFGGADSGYLGHIAESCGGKFLQAESSEVLGSIYKEIGNYMANDYVLEFDVTEQPELFKRFLEIGMNISSAYSEEDYNVGVSYEDILKEQGQAPLADYFQQIGGSDKNGGQSNGEE